MKRNDYVVFEKIRENYFVPIKDEHSKVVCFDTFDEAEVERIYFQPDYDNLLVVVKI